MRLAVIMSPSMARQRGEGRRSRPPKGSHETRFDGRTLAALITTVAGSVLG